MISDLSTPNDTKPGDHLIRRPPNSSSDSLDHLSESIRRVFAKVPNRPNIIIGGDFNLD